MSATSLVVGYCALGTLGVFGVGAILMSELWYFSSSSTSDKDAKKAQASSIQAPLAEQDTVEEESISTDSVNPTMSAEDEWKLKARDIRDYLKNDAVDFLKEEGEHRDYVVKDLLVNFEVGEEEFFNLWLVEDSTFDQRKDGFLALLQTPHPSRYSFCYAFCKEVFEEDQDKKIKRRHSF